MPDTMGTLLGQSRTRPSLHSRLTWLIPALGESVWTRLPATITLLLFLKKFYFILERPGFNPWVGKIPWRSARQPTPVFLPGESPWTEEPDGLHRVAKSRTRLKQCSTHTSISQKSPEFKLHSNPILVLLVSFPSLPYSVQSIWF